MTHLFSPLTLRGTTVRNRVWLAPMCQYSAVDGLPQDWHLAHLGAMASGGFGLLLTEATAVVPEGRITPQDTGLWSDAHTEAWARIVDFVHARGALIGTQLAHAGRKASTFRPWDERSGSVPTSEGGWIAPAPSAEPFPGYAVPAEMSRHDIDDVVLAFAAATRRALAAGFDTVEVHAAHGYLLHEFLSPLSNHRTDGYGGSLENRARLLLEVVDAVRRAWPTDRPVLVRISATDWTPGGLTVEESGVVAGWMADHGVDLVDVSSGGNVPAEIPLGPGYQVPLARAVREAAGLPVGAVGLLTTGAQAEEVLAEGSADVVLLGRAALRDPMWPLRAAAELGIEATTGGAVHDGPIAWQPQHERGAWRR
ncbi:NADH:flavin oxidoreductase/NADH oxidase [Actinotalea sp.]|uniref:NADH:flavin oxidoreductase/NADH oxidase n=1 Tax=Actinotalea sp. TaxID=1872145 RepID=UPI003569A31F